MVNRRATTQRYCRLALSLFADQARKPLDPEYSETNIAAKDESAAALFFRHGTYSRKQARRRCNAQSQSRPFSKSIFRRASIPFACPPLAPGVPTSCSRPLLKRREPRRPKAAILGESCAYSLS